MAIFPVSPKPIGRFVKTPSIGTARQAGAAYHPNSAHTHSMLSQASRVPRLANIGSVQAHLKAHAGRVGPGTKGSKR